MSSAKLYVSVILEIGTGTGTENFRKKNGTGNVLEILISIHSSIKKVIGDSKKVCTLFKFYTKMI